MQKSKEQFVSRIRLFWFTSKPPVMWADRKTCCLREWDGTCPLPVFHRCVSSRCTERLPTYALRTGLWGGSFHVHSPLPSNTNKAWSFLHLPFQIVPTHHSSPYPCLSVQYFPDSALPTHQHKVSPLSLYSFPPFSNLGHFFYLDTLVNSRLRDVLAIFLTPSLLFCLQEAKVVWEIKSSMQLGKLFTAVGIKVTAILANPKRKPSRRQQNPLKISKQVLDFDAKKPHHFS